MKYSTIQLGGEVVTLFGGDNRDVLTDLPDNSIDSVVTDPPYALNFMGKKWDVAAVAHDVEFWKEIYRVLKPGGHLLTFGGTRTNHRQVCAIEDAGFEIRDMIAWLYGTGFPKSHDVSKGIDKAAGAAREVVGVKVNTYDGANRDPSKHGNPADQSNIGKWGLTQTPHGLPLTAPATPEAAQWAGWGTALKPALEPICLARKPLEAKTVAANVLEYGTGAINVDGCRVATNDKLGGGGEKAETAGQFTNEGWRRPWMDDPNASEAFAAKVRANVAKAEVLGRFPANVIHDGSDEVVTAFPISSTTGKRSDKSKAAVVEGTQWLMNNHKSVEHTDSGSAARFFYSAKANKKDRANSKHPTVKPVALMRYLCRLITPPGGTVLDPFAGSGTTGEACRLEGFKCVLIEREAEYLSDIERRFA